MTSLDDDAAEDRFAELLAEYDDALAGQRQPPTVEADADATLIGRLNEAQACLDLLESAWPRNRPANITAVPEPMLTDSVGRFRLRRELGRGGFGVVFLADDPRLNRPVALKLPRPEVLVSGDLRSRWQREAKAAARLSHPNLVPIYEFGDAGPYAYLVTEYVAGLSLAAWLKEQTAALPPREIAAFLLPLADAVAYMHDQGVLHRDIKPSNVLLQSAGKRLACAIPRLTDFGLAKLTDESVGDGAPERCLAHRPTWPRAGRQPGSAAWAIQRHLRPGGPSLRDDRGASTISRGERRRHDPATAERRAAAAPAHGRRRHAIWRRFV